MKNDPEMELIRLFAEVGDPGQGDAFVERVSKRIASRRNARRATQALLAGSGLAVLVLLTPWVMDLIGYVALGSNVLASHVAAVILSPVGWVLGGTAGLFAFLRWRP